MIRLLLAGAILAGLASAQCIDARYNRQDPKLVEARIGQKIPDTLSLYLVQVRNGNADTVSYRPNDIAWGAPELTYQGSEMSLYAGQVAKDRGKVLRVLDVIARAGAWAGPWGFVGGLIAGDQLTKEITGGVMAFSQTAQQRRDQLRQLEVPANFLHEGTADAADPRQLDAGDSRFWYMVSLTGPDVVDARLCVGPPAPATLNSTLLSPPQELPARTQAPTIARDDSPARAVPAVDFQALATAADLAEVKEEVANLSRTLSSVVQSISTVKPASEPGGLDADDIGLMLLGISRKVDQLSGRIDSLESSSLNLAFEDGECNETCQKIMIAKQAGIIAHPANYRIDFNKQ